MILKALSDLSELEATVDEDSCDLDSPLQSPVSLPAHGSYKVCKLRELILEVVYVF